MIFGFSNHTPNLHKCCELGSGNGYLASVLASVVEDCEVWVTDDDDHADLMRRTVEKNRGMGLIKGAEERVKVVRLLWGEDDLGETFDFIFGTDVVYRDHLHAPFLSALCTHLSPTGTAIVGVCMSDTSVSFFDKLREAGFVYERMDDAVMPEEMRGDMFALLAIERDVKSG